MLRQFPYVMSGRPRLCALLRAQDYYAMPWSRKSFKSIKQLLDQTAAQEFSVLRSFSVMVPIWFFTLVGVGHQGYSVRVQVQTPNCFRAMNLLGSEPRHRFNMCGCVFRLQPYAN